MKPAEHATPARYVVVSPVRDEAQYLDSTITSMVGQTTQPVEWVLVNDGSTDGTGEIIDRWASQVPWIRAVHRPNRGLKQCEAKGTDESSARPSPSRGMRARQAKEIEAFYEGYERISASDWDFVVKLDGDLSFAPDYFARCFAEFAEDPKLGIGGGVICHDIEGRLEVESAPDFHVRGATKIYRRLCWEQIGGVIRGAGWDTLDEVKANMFGWSTRSFPSLKVTHHRFTGAANGAWQNAVKNGVWSYISGYHPLFMLLRCGKSLFRKPYITGSLGLLYGFALGYIQRVPQVADAATIRYLRDQQLRRMTFRATVWK
jgi:poly-beta-1,6-N-acetyl-D-glucosamine synthase